MVSTELPGFGIGRTIAANSVLRQRLSTLANGSLSTSLQSRRRHARVRLLRTTASADPSPLPPKRIVFLGTPAVAARSLQLISDAITNPPPPLLPYPMQLVGVVSQPPAPVGRKRRLTPSPVHALAEDLGVSHIWTPQSAKDDAFLAELDAAQPDLCITAAYGNILPKRFLAMPKYGTLNIHPSLLPAFRGAAPVPRALEAGVSETGVSVAFTVYKMDAGPIARQVRMPLAGTELAPDLLDHLFVLGTRELIDILPALWSRTLTPTEQDHARATQAAKLHPDESRLAFTENATHTHNKVRALAGWPGTWADFALVAEDGSEEAVRLKVVRTEVARPEGAAALGVHEVALDGDGKALRVVCDDGSVLRVLEVQPPGKKVMDARSFWNGLRGRTVHRKRVPH